MTTEMSVKISVLTSGTCTLASERTFFGYKRQQGGPGIRNTLLILNVSGLTQPAARKIQATLSGAIMVSMPHGNGLTGNNDAQVNRILLNLATNPNVGAVLVLSSDRRRADLFHKALPDSGKPVEFLSLGDCDRDIITFTARAVRSAAQLLVSISRQSREICAFSDLTLGLQCGMSDPTSGIAANPLLGLLSDAHVDAGGTVVFSETAEWLGSERAVAERAVSKPISDAILEAVARREGLAVEAGLDLLGNNPNQANIDSGISTIEDKAIGSIAKSGSRPISSMLEFAERPASSGLHAMDGPSFSPESLTGLAAAGAQIILFTTGCGNSYVSALCPTVKITANPTVALQLTDQIDFDCSDLITGDLSLTQANASLEDEVVAIASGALTLGEVLQEGDEVISRFGESL